MASSAVAGWRREDAVVLSYLVAQEDGPCEARFRSYGGVIDDDHLHQLQNAVDGSDSEHDDRKPARRSQEPRFRVRVRV
jgi:hypothetical protein